jgi:SAM-dependent methyltransferase
MADHSNLEEYSHPALYDLENPDFEPEGSFYLSIAQETGGPVLELGCGTGRYTIPVARSGLEISGLDLVPEMLERSKAKAGDLPIQWIEADARDFHLGRRFKLIFEGGSVFMHMLTNADQLRFLACVREHIAPEGRFVLSLLFPHPAELRTDLEEKEWFNYPDGQGGTVRVSGTDAYDELRQVKTETAVRRVISAEGQETMHVAPLQLRYTFPQEIELLLDRAGFDIIERYGGPDRSPLTGNSRHVVLICAARRGDEGDAART